MRLKKYIKFKMRAFVAKSWRTKILMLIVLLLLYVVIYFIVLGYWFSKNSDVKTALNLPNVIVHLDFKGSPPKLTYLKTLLPRLQELGVTGLLLEYEDMFPYEDKLVNLSARNCYSRSDLYDFIVTASQAGFELIPLIQSFGHMEHVLKLRQFQHLREEALYPDSLCPSRVESQDLIKNMVEQVVTFHNNISPLKHFHIGCDEVFHINKCHLCARRGLTDTDIFVKHVKSVTKLLKILSPNTTILMWDDGLRNIPIYKWDNIIQNLDIEPVYWDYRPSLSVSHVNFMKYHEKFGNIWIASAFKGADGRVATFPDLKRRFLNHFSWLSLMHNYKLAGTNDVYSFKGFILTGWSRYSHMDPPCELLPIAIPSLYLNLLLVKHFQTVGYSEDDKRLTLNEYIKRYLDSDFIDNAECDSTINIDYLDTSQCNFEGNDLFNIHKHLSIIHSDITFNVNDDETGLASVDFYSKTHNININKVKEDIKWCNETIRELLFVENKLRNSLSPFYDNFFINEYIDYKLHNWKHLLYTLSKNLNDMLIVRSWDRRPYA
ncbi:hexosaminidase D-like [Colias croceus]|uniref:hexosaminidase D-like n=1 Tax=Colias crocea TaxID=72248 RepID=UPI001E27A341|nr:hexosaminidase D-like [Colias croceus]